VISSCVWSAPPARPNLGERELHLWRAHLDQPADCIYALAQTLSAEEQARAARLRFERDRLHFIARHGILRIILGRYTHLEPGQVRFCYNTFGKPALDGTGQSALHFNLAYSQGLALYALACAMQGSVQIGIDLEYAQPISELDQIAQQFFTTQEQARLRALAGSQQVELFYTYWTCKEALLKALGCGLEQPLNQVDIQVQAGQVVRVVNLAGDVPTETNWLIEILSPASGYMAALAIEGLGWQLKYWDFDAS
jgi:4'-phosphopantetheinyl transferase